MLLLRLEELQARDLVDKGNILDIQDPALVITVNAVDYKTRRIRHAGVNANFDEVFDVQIDKEAYKSGGLMLEVEAFHKGVCGKKNVHLGKGKASLKSLVADYSSTVRIQIPLTFYVGTNLNSVIPDGFKKGIVYMRATVYDSEASKGMVTASKTYWNLNTSSGTTPKNGGNSQQAASANPFTSNMWSTVLQVGSNSVGVEKLADDSKAEFVSQIFGDVGELIDDFQCALVTSKIMLQGRMYLTCSFICFYSNIFGKTKKLRIPYNQVRTISKIADPVLGIIYSIIVETDVKLYTFRSFWDIDESHRVLQASYEEYMASSGKGRSSSISTTASSAGASYTRDRRESTNIIDTEEISGPMISNLTSSSLGGADDQSCDIHCVDNFRGEFDLCKRKIAVIMEQRLPVSVEEFASLFVEDNAEFSFKMYHEMVKDTNVSMSSWTGDETVGSQYQEYSRELRFFKPVNLPGLASTRGIKYQRYKRYDDLGLFVYSSTHLEDVPAADTFSVEDTVVVRSAGTQSVLIDITFEVKFVKNTFLRAMIENPTNAEMKKWLQAFYDHIYKICLEYREKMNRDARVASNKLEPSNLEMDLSKKEEESWRQKMIENFEDLKSLLKSAERDRYEQNRLIIILLFGLLIALLYIAYLLQSMKSYASTTFI